MDKYKKGLPYLCTLLFTVACMACTNKAEQKCSSNSQGRTDMRTGIQTAQVIVDDKAKASLTKQRVEAVYCVAMGAS